MNYFKVNQWYFGNPKYTGELNVVFKFLFVTDVNGYFQEIGEIKNTYKLF